MSTKKSDLHEAFMIITYFNCLISDFFVFFWLDDDRSVLSPAHPTNPTMDDDDDDDDDVQQCLYCRYHLGTEPNR